MEELSRKNEMDLSWECYLSYSLRRQYISSLLWSNLSFSWWKKKKRERKKKKVKKSKKPKSMPFVVFRRDHLRFTSGIICRRGSFAALYSTENTLVLCATIPHVLAKISGLTALYQGPPSQRKNSWNSEQNRWGQGLKRLWQPSFGTAKIQSK